MNSTLSPISNPNMPNMDSLRKRDILLCRIMPIAGLFYKSANELPRGRAVGVSEQPKLLRM